MGIHSFLVSEFRLSCKSIFKMVHSKSPAKQLLIIVYVRVGKTEVAIQNCNKHVPCYITTNEANFELGKCKTGTVRKIPYIVCLVYMVTFLRSTEHTCIINISQSI